MATFLVAVAKTSDWRTLLAGFTLAPGLKVVRAWCQALEETAWIASAIKKQKALNARAQFAFSFLLIPGPQTVECCPYTEWLFRINWPNLETTSQTRSKVFLRVTPGPVKMTIVVTRKVNRGGSTSNKMLCSAVWCCRGVESCYNRRERWPQRKWSWKMAMGNFKDLGRDGRTKLEDSPWKIEKTHSFLIHHFIKMSKKLVFSVWHRWQRCACQYFDIWKHWDD